ncbi:hypothetical protein AX15_002433 [Amanita polypyramis BW_CC]|nr:hypothetical protein AX15_002433 [Amanita polypyramis BW_CC]
MAPPATLSAPRNNYPASTIESGPSSRTGNTLYTSILAPPPSKQARTIHNANDPPIPSTAPPSSSRSRVSRGEGRSRGRAKAAERPPKVSETPSRRRKTSSIDKGKQKQAVVDAGMNVDTDGDVDMKAAVTLTSWRLHNRQPTVAGSPRSSFDGSEAGSTYSHFAQSSTRTTTATTVASAASPAAASTTSTAEPPARSRTPSPTSKLTEHATPRAAPTDDEAADLMLLFATSPSPIRPTTISIDARDTSTFRALPGSNNALLSKGRVLFPSSGDIPGAEEPSPGGERRQQYRHQHTRSGPPLTRGGDGSFSSSISSQLGRRGSADANSGNSLSRASSSSQLGPSQLLPPPPLPTVGTTTPEHTTSRRGGVTQSPKSSGGQTTDFNFSDFINASPSPARAGTVQMLSLGQSLGSGAPKPSLGLRADVGRKLFEEEQMRNASSSSGAGGVKSPRARGLGAGIDLDAKHS